MKPLTLAALLGALLLILNGCATGSHIVTGDRRPAIDPSAVKIYGAMPDNAEVVAMVTASLQDAGQSATDKCIKKLRKSAAKLGANGIVIAGFLAGPGQSGVGIGTGVASTGGVVTTTGSFFSSPTTTINGTAVYVPAP
jgi:uncharacterized protein YbjQ (UPF0145 family)